MKQFFPSIDGLFTAYQRANLEVSCIAEREQPATQDWLEFPVQGTA